MIFTYFDEGYENIISEETIIHAGEIILSFCQITSGDLTIRISGDEEIWELNKQFLGIDSATDVLSFPTDEFDPDEQTQYLGDIIISLPTAESQAMKSGHTLKAEIELLTIHGILHLLGYDHTTQEEKSAMWKIQSEALRLIGSPITNVSEE